MKKTYIIVSTWNGEGYSEENMIHSEVTIEGDNETHIKDKAMVICHMYAQMEVDGCPDAEVEELEYGYTHTLDDEDYGSFQFFEKTDDAFGVVILTNINDVNVVNESEYKSLLEMAVEQADNEELEDVDLGGDRVFIGAYNGDYDYQFERIR